MIPTFLTTYLQQIQQTVVVSLPFFLFLYHVFFEKHVHYTYTLLEAYGIESNNANQDQDQDQTPDQDPTSSSTEPKPPKSLQPEKYEDKYKDRYNKTETKDYDEETWKSFKTKILMETTPLGNVIMYYDYDKEVFVYYSDTSIPYRFLETVSRKYVSYFDCKKVYINMDEELEKAKAVLLEKKSAEQEALKPSPPSTDQPNQPTTASAETEKKKNVFAKLKTYNNQAIKDLPKKHTQTPSSAQPTKTPNPSSSSSTQNTDAIVKERSNRYSYEGKMMNFSFLKKVDRKAVDKSYALTFKEFKELQMKQKNMRNME